MKNVISVLMILCACAFTSHAQGNKSQTTDMEGNKTILVAFFSRTGENYAVGNIKKGNTHIVAEMIANETGGKLFQIETLKPYPDEYKACVDIAKTEKENNARPKVQGDVKVEDYDIIFLGYPNWWGDMPMAVYTFIEKHNWNGKTVIPFCPHEGSGLSGTERKLKDACKGAKVSEGLAIKGTTAQNSQPQALKTVQTWLKKVNN